MKHQPSTRHVLSVIVDNEPGVLARVVGLFSGRGYNIESLTVAVTGDEAVSRITVATSGPPPVIEQIIAQLGRLIPVHRVDDLTGPHVERELVLVRLAATGEARSEAMRLADVYGARAVDATTASFIFELAGSGSKVTAFVALMRELGAVEVARTGAVGLPRG